MSGRRRYPPPSREVFDLLPRPQRLLAPRGLAARMARPEAEAALRCRHRRRRGSRPCHRVLPREGARPRQHRRAGEGLSWRRQYGAQHDDRPLELPPRPQRAFLRAVAQVVGRAVAGPQLQCDVQRARRAEPRSFARRHGRRDAPRKCDAPQRHRRRVSAARRDRPPDSEPRLLARRALPDPGRPAAAARRHGAPRCGRVGLCARGGCTRRRHHPAMRGDRHPRRKRCDRGHRHDAGLYRNHQARARGRREFEPPRFDGRDHAAHRVARAAGAGDRTGQTRARYISTSASRTAANS